MKLAAAGLLVLILLVAPDPVLAKLPWHSVEILPAAPVAGEPLTVVVRFWDDAAHSQPSAWWPSPTMGGLVEFQGATGRFPVTLTRTDVDAPFHAEVTLPEGSWRLAIVLWYSDISGPADVELAMVTVAAAPSATAPLGAALIGLALVVAGVTGVIWRGRQSSSPQEPG